MSEDWELLLYGALSGAFLVALYISITWKPEKRRDK
jgi:hypothetical protein